MKRILLIGITSIFLAHNALAVDYFVKNAGDDSKDGLSDANAWKTITKFNTADLDPGDTGFFNKGDTFSDAILFISATDSGSSGSWVTIGSYGTGADPIFQGGILVQLASYVRIENIESDGNATFEPMYVSGSHDITFYNITIDGKNQNNGVINQTGFVSFSHSGTGTPCYNLLIDESDIFDCGDPVIGISGGGVTFGAYTYDSIVQNSNIYDNTDDNILVWSATAGITNTGCIVRDNNVYNTSIHQNKTVAINLGFRTTDCIAERNNVYTSWVGIAFDANSSGNIARNNEIEDCQDSYVKFLANSNGDCQNHKFINNTIKSENGFDIGMAIVIDVVGTNDGHTIKNNISYSTTANFKHIDADNTTSDFVSDYNCFFSSDGNPNFVIDGTTYTSLATYQSGEGQDASSIDDNPLLGSNNTLNTSSPCISTGIKTLDVQDDFRQGSRRSDYDMGAYAYDSVIKDCLIKDAVIE